MPIDTISQTISTIPEAGHRGVDVQTTFVTKQEDFQDHLQGTTVSELNALKTQINTTVNGMNDAVTNVNTKASEADADALSASNSAGVATTKAGEASTSASQASASATKASQWADAAYNVEVEVGKYSAKHWATVAQSAAIEDTKGANIASAATTTVGTAGLGDYIHITGTTTITSFGTAASAGTRRTLIFDGALTVTHNATSLICPDSANIVTVAGTIIEIIAETTANWRVVSVMLPSVTSKDLASTKLVNSISELKLISGNITDKLNVLGYYEKGDGGGGTFYWDATSTETDNGGTIIQATGVTTGRWKRVFSGAVNVKWFGAKGDRVTDDTTAIQRAIDFTSISNGKLLIPSGEFMISQLVLKTGVYIEGFGYDITRLVQIIGSNKNIIVSDGYGISDIHNAGIINLEIDGNYFTSDWDAANGTLGNTSGNGLCLQGYSLTIDIGTGNIAGVGAIFDSNTSENSSLRDQISDVSLYGRDFGKEGLVIKGPNDWILRKAWIGRAGILPRPNAETNIATSTTYSGDPVDGIVLEDVNIEIGDIHVYACWSGTGFRTRGVCRLTKGGRIISESNRAQAVISSGTYGSAFFDIRRLSLLHPNWTGAIPTYTYPMEEWDGVTNYAGSDFSCEITCKRTITSDTRVDGATACVVSGGSIVNFLYSNSINPSTGLRYTGDGITLSSDCKGANIKATGTDCNGKFISVYGEANKIDFSVSDSLVGIYRNSLSNSMRGNNISGSIVNCNTGFVSVGKPSSEIVTLSMEMDTGEIPFSGDIPDVNKGQIWNISAAVNNIGYSTLQFLQSPELKGSTTNEQTVVVPHRYLYTPDFRLVQYSLDDRPGTNTLLEYCYLTAITSTDLTFAYKYSATTGPTFNQRINVKIG